MPFETMLTGRRRFLVTLGKGIGFIAGLASGVTSRAQTNGRLPRVGALLDQDWRFTKGDALDNADAYASAGFDDSAWRRVELPHDYAIEGPFSTTGGGGMGRLPSAGVVWYRKNLSIPASSAGKAIFLDIDGAMSYSKVWLNGQPVGGWPYGYASFRLNVTPYAKTGGDNVLAIRLDNPPASSRWYPGGGLYRNVWLVQTSSAHVAQWGTYITTPRVSPAETVRKSHGHDAVSFA
jgi:beta-galactosidase